MLTSTHTDPPCGHPRNHAEEIANARASVQAGMRLDLAVTLETLPVTDREATIATAILTEGGTFVPRGPTNWGPHQAELSLFGVIAYGADRAECTHNWVNAVMRSAQEAATPC